MKHVFTLLAFALMSSASAQVSNHVSEDGLRYWSDFDGSVVDQSVHQTSTSLSGALPTEDRNGTAAGAMFFDGVDDHVELFAVEGGVTFEDELTVAAWMKAEEFLGGHHPRLFHSSEGVGGGFDRWFFTWSPASAGSVVGFGVGNGQNSTVGVDSQNSVTPGEWHHVAAIFQSGMVKVLVDGVLESEAPLAFTSLNHIDAPVFLGSALGNSHFNGALDEVGLWDRALSVEEVLDLYLMPSGDAQLPDDVPSDGLVAYYELEDSLLDLGEGESHGSSESVQFSCETEDDGFCSLVLTEESSYVNLPSSLELNGTQGGVSMGGWVKLESMETSDWKLILDVTDGTANNNWGDRIQMGVMQDESGLFWNSGAHFDNDITVDYLLDTPWDIEFGRWYHFMVTYDFDGSLTHYIDGVPVNDTDVSNVGDCFLAGGNNGSRRIGARAHNQNTDLKWEGGLRSIGIWERPLAPSEVEMMFQLSSVQLSGCTYAEACNYDFQAVIEDGTCDFTCLTMGCGDLAAINYDPYANDGSDDDCLYIGCQDELALNYSVTANYPGECIYLESCPGDYSEDGVVDITDLLDLFQLYGGECELVDEIWSCGDPLEYQGYDYSTVQIGEQCWFKENLRSEVYANGDMIQAAGSAEEFAQLSGGAKVVYGEWENSCSHDEELFDACNPSEALEAYGYLYNWHVTSDDRGICPSGWSVPSQEDWGGLFNHFGGNAVAGEAMKTSEGWAFDGGGSNVAGFDAVPGSQRNTASATWESAGAYGFWWSSTSTSPDEAWGFKVSCFVDNVYDSVTPMSVARSIRCIQDSE